MRFRSLEITFNSRSALEEQAKGVLTERARSQDFCQSVAKMARSEVKNYLAELAEESELPFGDVAGFLRGLKTLMAGVSTTNLAHDEPADGCNCTCSNCSGCLDAPFNVIDMEEAQDAQD
jgi:hypothetical protein